VRPYGFANADRAVVPRPARFLKIQMQAPGGTICPMTGIVAGCRGWDGWDEAIPGVASSHQLSGIWVAVAASPPGLAVAASGTGYRANRWSERALAFAASSSRFFAPALDSSEARSRFEILVMSSTAAVKAASFALDGLVKPLIFLTNWSDAA